MARSHTLGAHGQPGPALRARPCRGAARLCPGEAYQLGWTCGHGSVVPRLGDYSMWVEKGLVTDAREHSLRDDLASTQTLLI